MKSQNTKSSSELKREVDREIRNVRRDLDEMTGALSPGNLLDRAVFGRHGRSLRASYDHLKNNPIGTAFLSMGTILLMEDEYNQTYETKLHNRFVDLKGEAALHKEEAYGKIDDFKGRISDMKENIQHRTMDLKETMRDKVTGIKDKIQHRKDAKVGDNFDTTDTTDTDVGGGIQSGVHAKVTDFADKFGDAKTRVNDTVSDISENVSGKVSDMGQQVSGKVSDIKENVQGKVQELRENIQDRVHSSSPSDYENWTSSADAPRTQKVKDAFSSARDRMSTGIDGGREKLRHGLEAGRETVSNMDPVTYMALGAGLGVLTGVSLPVSERERSFVNDKMSDRLSTFDSDLRSAINECSGLLKDLVIDDVKNYAMKVL